MNCNWKNALRHRDFPKFFSTNLTVRVVVYLFRAKDASFFGFYIDKCIGIPWGKVNFFLKNIHIIPVFFSVAVSHLGLRFHWMSLTEYQLRSAHPLTVPCFGHTSPTYPQPKPLTTLNGSVYPQKQIAYSQKELAERLSKLSHSQNQLAYPQKELAERLNELTYSQNQLAHSQNQLAHPQKELAERLSKLTYPQNELTERLNELFQSPKMIRDSQNILFQLLNPVTYPQNDAMTYPSIPS
ncbi:hypothetical protein EDC14_101968 [Hydrogenispora ethanolica]|uniref:Uncharacterized protein n=2 Tax=Hydrogenispora ethanolica TaxID=1082276 RepID=A0A4R1RFA8_HYDET|nr:hypothetical protein EDC14_101968 [Hydrogenispora ethanolica]